MPTAIVDLAAFLAGTWRVERRIVPVRGVPAGGFAGRATVVAGDGDLVYEERGEARIGDHVGEAWRRLRYEVDGPRALVRFDDGRAFHDLDLTSGRWWADHPCGEDLYRGEFVVDSHDAWEQRWRVEGPGKAYESRTRLVRVTDRATPAAAPARRSRAVAPRS